MDALRKAELELDKEMRKQVDIIYSSAAIAFARYWNDGWGPLRIRRIFDETLEAWNECGETNEMSMLEMLENETGIEVKIPDTDKSWHDLAFLNSKIDMGRMSRAQWIYMRQRQKQWIGAMVLACMLLALHRKYGFGPERLLRLMSQIDDIRVEFRYDRKALIKACEEEARVVLKEVIM